jgi:hypothetical protein
MEWWWAQQYRGSDMDGGVLFIDVIGEFTIQMNKLLKVWRTEGYFGVLYSSEEKILHIYMIFSKGLPGFRW